MPLYYFDTRDGHHLIRDELGIELDGIAKARDEATRGLADLVKTRSPAQPGGSFPSRFATMPNATFSGLRSGSRLRLSQMIEKRWSTPVRTTTESRRRTADCRQSDQSTSIPRNLG
jgi:hypothetical protein